MSTRINFTKAAIKSLPVPAQNKQYDTYYDEQVKKLMLLIYPSKNKTFFVSKKVGNKAIKYKLGTYPDLSIENARKLALKALGEFADGKNPQEKKRQYQKEMTFGSFFKQYCKDSQKKSIADDEKYYRLYLESDWANKRLSEIKLADIEEKHRYIGENNGVYAANHAHSLIRTLYNKAITKGIFIGVNPPPNLACRCFTHSTETALWIAKSPKSKYTFNYAPMKQANDGKQMKDVWRFTAPARAEKAHGKHPAQKPVALLQRMILASTNPGDVVLDPFNGSGSTGMAAMLTGRQYIGVELEQEYCKLSAARFQSARKTDA